MPVGVQCPISSSLGEFPSYWDWLWCPGLSPLLVSIALPFAFQTWCFPFALIRHWISIVFLLYGRRIATHSVNPSLTHLLGEFPGLGLALVPDVVVPEAELFIVPCLLHLNCSYCLIVMWLISLSTKLNSIQYLF